MSALDLVERAHSAAPGAGNGAFLTELADEIERLRTALDERDRLWSSELETGYDDCPPRTPEEVGDWWNRHFAKVDTSKEFAEREKLSKLMLLAAGATPREVRRLAVRVREIIVACDEVIGPDGCCDCSRQIVAVIVETRRRAAEAKA